jgi:pimeloyl-ACP methyl ester carboxylesterase
MDLVRRLDIVERLRLIDAPTLVCVGSLDPVTPVPAAEEIVGALPAHLGQLEVVDGSGHFTWLDASDRYWPPIVEFVTRIGADDPSAARSERRSHAPTGGR